AEIAEAARDQGLEGPRIGERIQQARTEAVAAVLDQPSSASAA
ncbi:MAG: hypothetical protein K0S48_1808, partial [Ramlibacter sp.]|nr:hypothetical protein [Ramlibacter sp.]